MLFSTWILRFALIWIHYFGAGFCFSFYSIYRYKIINNWIGETFDLTRIGVAMTYKTPTLNYTFMQNKELKKNTRSLAKISSVWLCRLSFSMRRIVICLFYRIDFRIRWKKVWLLFLILVMFYAHVIANLIFK